MTAAAIDSSRMLIRIEQGKGGKDRYVMLSPQLLQILRTYGAWPDRVRGCSRARIPGEPVSVATLVALPQLSTTSTCASSKMFPQYGYGG